MPIYALPEAYVFPDPNDAEVDGILAVGGDLSPQRLVLAYSVGVFPWPIADMPLAWFSPDPRMLLDFADLRLTRSLRRSLRRPWRRTIDRDFRSVIRACSAVTRKGETGTWITEDMIAAYERLHELGFAHSVEVWGEDDRLIGGLYGVSIGDVFVGESMFHHARDASKVAFATLAAHLATQDFAFLDCQLHTPHLERLGAQEWPRRAYLDRLSAAVTQPTRRGQWTLPGALSSGDDAVCDALAVREG